ncbi:hypothetical protein C2857_004481 [Epichloe festucae Fl1]|uniref:DUF1760-domain-containing protein n=1 Tax=Epichloe festucae (strain Fl1) TaxID=877507 RepID=A0A7U3Q0P0_EPIFF|nr:hypothetical protein C2857_004481 [Epichloe festucae Fl1]
METPESTTKPTTEEVIQRLKESRPPATDKFTYLTIIDKSLSPEVLPTLQDILQDVELTADIGWDLVDMLISVPGSQGCLESIARLGSPREVILKVLQVMETTTGEGENASVGNKYFVTLCAMLGILHKRLQVRAPSRFLHTTLDTVYRCYDPTNAESTAAIISLLQSLSAQKRPPLPTRQSSTVLETPMRNVDSAESAPDPEADQSDKPDADEPRIINHLLQSFITCVIEAYVNSNNLEWASRVLEYTYPQRIVPGKKTMMQAFNEESELRVKDALAGQLAAVAGDLGFTKMAFPELREILEAPIVKDSLAIEFDPSNIDEIKLSGGGLLCLIAYWVFAADIFDADQPRPAMYMFPDHHALLKHYIGEDPQSEVLNNPGTMEALVVLAIWLDGQNKIAAGGETSVSDAKANYMPYHHLITLISVFHPNVRVRNASTVIAGTILHSNPDEDGRLAILEDLLENCMFSSLQACAVTWLREEVIAARKNNSKGHFSSPDCFDAIQYTLFPSLTHLKKADMETLLEFWAEGSPFHLQVANFALFLFSNDYKDLAPAGMAAAIEHRYVQPLLQTATRVMDALDKGEIEQPSDHRGTVMELSVLKDILERVPLQ